MVTAGPGLTSLALTDSAGRPLYSVRRSNKLTYMPWGESMQPQAALGGALTFLYTLPLDDDIFAFRLMFGPTPAGPDVTIGKAAAVVSATQNDYANPTGGGTPVNVTWNNAGADIDIPAPYAAAAQTGRIMPASPAVDPIFGSGLVNQVDLSDWTPIAPVSPATGGKRFLMVRVLWPNQPYFRATQFLGVPWTGNPAINQGNDIGIYVAAGDNVTGFPVVAGQAPTVLGPMIGYQVLSRTPGISVMALGDSDILGTTSGGINGFLGQIWGQYARLSAAIFAPSQCSVGNNSASFAAQASYYMSLIEPQICFINAFTPNDPAGSYATTMLPRALWLARRVQKLGGVPVLIGPAPNTAWQFGGAANYAGWIAAVGEIRAVAASGGMPLLDPASILGSVNYLGALTGGYNPAFSADNVHGNDAAHAQLAAVALQIIQAIGGT